MELSHQYHDHLVLLFSCLVLLVSRPFVQSYSNISLDTPFSPPHSWSSPSGDFAFGFRPLETDGTLFLLAVWFDKVPNKTVVWCANGDNPVRDGSTAQLAPSGWLLLKDHTGQVVWNTSTGVATHAAMLDSGNLVLVDSKSAPVWQTFDNPTDTILPTQVLGLGSHLYARLMDTDYSKGRFQLVLQNDGNLVFYPVAVPTGFRYDYYWQSGTRGFGVRLIFDEDKGSIYLSDQKNTSLFRVTSSNLSTGKYYQRASLDPDGVFRHYSLPKDSPGSGSRGWEVRDTNASNICDLVKTHYGSGACGFNSYCQRDTSMRAVCQCPPRYSFVDPSRKYKGCKPDFVAQSCDPGSESQYKFVNLTNVDWPLNDAEHFSPLNESECTDNCLKDCLCTVAIYNEGNCWKKRQPLSNGKRGSDISQRAFIKVSKFETTPKELEEENRFRRTWVLVGSLFLGCSVLLNFAQSGARFYIKNRRPPLHRNSNAILPESTLTLRYFTYKELEEATRGFSEEVGRGAFGIVYKGFLSMPSSTVVAVKKLETLQHEAEKDFTNEVRSIGQTHHKNLVRLYGFCKEGNHRLLVYEFMSNGSLNRFLFSDGDRPEWSRRVQIALGIAGGLAYLHEECRTQIIHCDIKPQNILLDDDLTARIADFGLAKLLGIQQTRTSTGLRGTIGYFAPEWFKNTPITAKVDVYSFGVMLLEIICCRRNLNWEMGESNDEKLMLADWAIECYRNRRLNQLVDDDEEATADAMRLERFVMVAISCIQEEPWLRPSMKKVTQMLEGAVAVSVPPNAYAA